MKSNIDLKFFDQCKNYFVYHHKNNLPFTRGFGEGRPLRSQSEYLEYRYIDLNDETFDAIKEKVKTHLEKEDPNLTYGVFRVSVEKLTKGYEINVGYYYI